MVKTTFEMAIDTWGAYHQAYRVNEELAELAIEVSRYVLDDDRADRTKILEELTDVEIMLKQLKIIFNYSEDELLDMKCKKIAKLQIKIDRNDAEC